MRVLAFGAHPNSIEFRCAGTLAKYAARGDEIFLCITTNGNIGSQRTNKEETAAIRHNEALEAAKVINAKLIWLGFEDEFLFDNVETRLKVIDAVRIAKPDVIFTHPFYHDYNPDHDKTGYLSFIARINATIKLIETEHPPHTKIPPMFYCSPFGGMGFGTCQPDHFVDITDTFDIKMKMFMCHKSTQGEWGRDAFGMDFADMIESENRVLAAVCGTPGVEYAEAFTLCKTWPLIADAYKYLP